MLELNRQAEVALHGQAADVEWTLLRHMAGLWVMVVEGVPDPKTRDGIGEVTAKREFTLNDEQASATVALFIGELENDQELNAKLYAIAEQVWKDVPMHFRPIP